MAGDEIAERLARLERQLEWTRVELAAVRALAESAVTAASPVPTTPSDLVPAEEPAPSAPPRATEGAALLATAWRALERGKASDAVTQAFQALGYAADRADVVLLDEIRGFASVAVSTTGGHVRMRAEQLGLRVEQQLTSLGIAAAATPAAPEAERPPAAAPTPAAPLPPRRDVVEPGLGDRAVVWLRTELTGPRAFAVAGGAVTLLGVIFLFVLAANRGWVGPAARVALGAAASLAAVGIGLGLRVRYGRVVAAFGAVGAGIAGAYATLAAATIIYSYLPAWAALLVAAGIAAAGAGIALAWSSQILAGLALVGAAVAPALFALDDQASWSGTSFALVVLIATIAVASPRRWLWLDATVALVAVAQVLGLAATAANDDVAAVVVAGVGAFTLLAAAISWQAYGGPALDAPSASFALAGGAIGLSCPYLVITDDRRLGTVLLVLALGFGATALGVARRWRDLGWTIGAAALLLGGVAAAFLVSGRSLTVVWAIEATVLAGLAWKLGAVRFEAASLVYLAAAVVHSVAVEIVPDWPSEAFDVPRSAAAGLFVLSGSALAVGLLQPEKSAGEASSGVAAALDPLWDALARKRVEIRAVLAVGSAILLVAGLATVLSGRTLTIVLAALATGTGLAAAMLGERRLQPFALGFLAFAAVHALSVEAPVETLTPDAAVDVLQPVPSLIALSVAAALLAALARFDDRGIAWLGPAAGPELHLGVLDRGERVVRAVLLLGAATSACWAAGLLATDVSYDAGQVVATALWSLLGTLVVLLATRARSTPFQVVGFVYVLAALVKSTAFDWEHLGDRAATASLLVVAAALLASGFESRWGNPADARPVEIVALGTGAAAALAAIVALGRLLGYDSRALGVAALAVAVVVVAVGATPYLRRRAGGGEPWLRVLANGYGAIGLVVLLFGESQIVLRGDAGTIALWAATAAALALVWRPLAEDRVWMAGLAVSGVTAAGSLALVTVPSRLVDATAHPATDLWALAVVVGAAWVVGLTTPPVAREYAQFVLAVAAALTLYGLSLGVLEIAEWVSGASVKTDFQRGHTALSALWGIGALSLYVVGLARDRRELRVVGLTLLGLALAKLFLYDLSSLSSITRALSFLAVGSILLAAGFFAERIVRPGAGGPPAPAPPSGT